MADFKKTELAIHRFADGVVTKAKINLQKSKATGSLMRKVRHELKVSKQGNRVSSFQLRFLYPDYGEYLDRGVTGAESGGYKGLPRKDRSGGTKIFAFKGIKPARAHVESIKKWFPFKGIRARGKDGKFTKAPNAVNSLAFAIATSTLKKGIKPRNWFSKAFERQFKKGSRDMTKAFALDYEKFLASTLQDRIDGNN